MEEGDGARLAPSTLDLDLFSLSAETHLLVERSFPREWLVSPVRIVLNQFAVALGAECDVSFEVASVWSVHAIIFDAAV